MKYFTIAILILVLVSFKRDVTNPVIIKTKSTFFVTDKIGNVYTVYTDELKKYNAKGELQKTFSFKKYGTITSIDVSNPLRILVFYKDFAKIILLDSQLSENGASISLENYGLEQCDLACTSFNNGIWLFNRQNNELIRLNENLQIVVNTGNLNTLLGMDLHPKFILENNGYIYLNDIREGILIFDIYGTYYKTIAIKGLETFKIEEDLLMYKKDSLYSLYNMKLLNTKDSIFNEIGLKDIQREKNSLYLRYADSVIIKTLP